MARRRRRYSGIVSLGGLEQIVSGSVNVTDVLLGLAVGAVSGLGLKYIINNYAPDAIKVQFAKLGQYAPLAAGLTAAAALFYAQGGSQSAKGNAIGAAGAGAAISLLSAVGSSKWAADAGLAGYGNPAVALNLSNYRGLLVDNAQRGGQMNGLIVDNNANLSRLGALSMGGDDELGYSDIVALRS